MAKLKGGTTIGGSIAYHGTNANLSTIPWTVGVLTLGDCANTQGFLNLWGYTGEMSTIKATTDNLHIDAAGAGNTYINYYTGTGGVFFGNGATGSNACVTAAGVFTGSGAGLTGTASSLTVGCATDANTLDGLTSACFARCYGRTTADYNTLCTSGTYGSGSGNANNPGASYLGIVVAKNSDVGLQIAGGYNTNDLWFRGWSGNASTWYAWNNIVHSGNIAAQSVCCAQNANAVDGLTSACFLRSSATDCKTAGNLIFYDGICLTLGTGSDLDIYHNGSNGYIQNGTGGLYIGATASENGIYVGPNTCTQLYFDNAAKLKTMVGGVCITGYNCVSSCGRSPVFCATAAFRASTTGYKFCAPAGCGCAVDWVATSDCRLKKCIEPITSALSKVNALCGVCYELCEDNTAGIGLIAQDVEKIEPRLVSKGEPAKIHKEKYGIEDETLGLKYDKFAGLFVEAIKELKLQNSNQQLQINDLKSEIKTLKNEKNI